MKIGARNDYAPGLLLFAYTANGGIRTKIEEKAWLLGVIFNVREFKVLI